MENYVHNTHTLSSTVPTTPRNVIINAVFQDGAELSWLPPTEPNGEVHYVIYYTPEGGTEQSIDTGSNLTHYNLTGLERNRVYTNITVQAVNSVGRSGRSAVIAQYNHTPPGESCMVNNSYYVNTVSPTEPNEDRDPFSHKCRSRIQ